MAGEFDTTDASFTPIQQLREDLNQADRVNKQVMRICCQLYRLAWQAGVDPSLPEMKAAEEQLKNHQCWDDTWGDGTREQGVDEADGSSGGTDQGSG